MQCGIPWVISGSLVLFDSIWNQGDFWWPFHFCSKKGESGPLSATSKSFKHCNIVLCFTFSSFHTWTNLSIFLYLFYCLVDVNIWEAAFPVLIYRREEGYPMTPKAALPSLSANTRAQGLGRMHDCRALSCRAGALALVTVTAGHILPPVPARVCLCPSLQRQRQQIPAF